LATLLVPHALDVHVRTLQAVSGAGQSLGWRHCRHAPVASQNLPPPSLHAVPGLALMNAHAPAAQVGTRHPVVAGAQSVGTRH
jgi:hypothetical protein